MSLNSRSSLAFRLGLAINATVIVVMTGFGIADYRQERGRHLADQVERLRQQAHVLHVAQRYLGDNEGFQSYLDAFCQQMDRHVSPGHHIIVLSPNGYIIARAHREDTLKLEGGMVQVLPGGSRRLWTDGLVELPDPQGHMLERHRLHGMLAKLRAASPREAVDQVLTASRGFCGERAFPDDATLITLWRGRDGVDLSPRYSDNLRSQHHS